MGKEESGRRENGKKEEGRRGKLGGAGEWNEEEKKAINDLDLRRAEK